MHKERLQKSPPIYLRTTSLKEWPSIRRKLRIEELTEDQKKWVVVVVDDDNYAEAQNWDALSGREQNMVEIEV